MAATPTRALARAALYRLATSERIERLARAAPGLERWALARARRYVAGTTLEDALAVVRDLRDRGLGASVDLFGEGLSDRDAIDAVVDRYLEAAGALGEIGGDVHLEVVPSHLGLDVSADFLRQHLGRIVAALPSGARLEISAEESWRTGRIVQIALEMAAEGAPVIATLQANLKRSEHDAQRLAEAAVPVRLVKGAYLEPAAVAHRWGEPTDLAFVRLAHALHAAGTNLTIATHDPVIRAALLSALPGIEVEMLLGVRPDDAHGLARDGQRVRIYVPFGEHWFRYWMRRVAESIGG